MTPITWDAASDYAYVTKRIRMKTVPAIAKRRTIGSYTQAELAVACTEDFALRCSLETSGSAHRVVLDHLYNLYVH